MERDISILIDFDKCAFDFEMDQHHDKYTNEYKTSYSVEIVWSMEHVLFYKKRSDTSIPSNESHEFTLQMIRWL